MTPEKDSIEVAADIARAWTLPASLYIAPSIFENEEKQNLRAHVASRGACKPGGEARRLLHYGTDRRASGFCARPRLENCEGLGGIFSDQIQVEDVAICETMQKNPPSRSYSRSRYSVKQEKGVYAFHRMYSDWMSRA